MTDKVEQAVERGRETLAAARLLAGEGFWARAISSAYFAVFYAAEAALLLVGETRSKHSGVVAAFGELIVKREGLKSEFGRLLHDLCEQRLAADYEGEASRQDAIDAVRDAERFLDAVEGWIRERPQ